MNKIYNSIGTMSGTSFDGVDVSLIRTDGLDTFEVKINLYEKFNEKIKSNLKKLKNNIKNIQDLNTVKESKLFIEVENQITDLHVKLIKTLILKSEEKINLIGFHGITLFHDPENKFTFQMGNIAKLLENLKLPVVYDFRHNDLNHGGQGAPLAPIFHKLILQKLKLKNKIFNGVVNIGGISNITYLKDDNILANDIGPGNCLIDEWCKEFYNINYDEDGRISSGTKPDLIIANNFIDRFNFNKNISFDFNDFSISEFRNLQKDIGLSTLTYITAHLILTFLNEKNINQIIVSGGGRKNKTLMNYLEGRAIDIDNFNFDGDFIESQAFAYLAVRSLNKLPITFPETTGVKTAVTGGVIKKV
jgi:anhydro-N-acetylmuramic acid kinase